MTTGSNGSDGKVDAKAGSSQVSTHKPRCEVFLDGKCRCPQPAVARYSSVLLCEEHERGVSEWWSKEPDYICKDRVRLTDLTTKELEALPGWWFTVDEVAEQQGVRPGTVHNWIRLGKLRAVKCRFGKRRIMEEDLQAYREGRPP